MEDSEEEEQEEDYDPNAFELGFEKTPPDKNKRKLDSKEKIDPYNTSDISVS